MEDDRKSVEEGLDALELYASAKEMIDAHRVLGYSRSDLRELMVHPDSEGKPPAVVFDTLWPEGS